MNTEAIVAFISGASAIVLILIGIFAELVRSRNQSNTRLDATIQNQDKLNGTLVELNRTLTDMDKRLVAVETTVSFFHPQQEREHNA